jgi:ABC-type sulfate/molybdate transport systems ATPase subunit
MQEGIDDAYVGAGARCAEQVEHAMLAAAGSIRPSGGPRIDINITLPIGTHAALTGPSGSGKSTLLRCLAGIEHYDGLTLTHSAGKIGYVMQEPACFPGLTCRANISYGLAHLPAQARAQRTSDLLRLFGLESLADTRAGRLSGGEQQRVALARSLAPRPALVLLDEPFTALDSVSRAAVRLVCARYARDWNISYVLVTHTPEDLGEADKPSEFAPLVRWRATRDGDVCSIVNE